METKIVPLSQIIADYAANPRQDLGDIDSLAAEISRDGQLVPLTVVAHPKSADKFVMIDGYRRYAALVKVHEKSPSRDSARVQVLPSNISPNDAIVLAAKMNVQRKSWTPFEKARAFVDIRDRLAKERGKAPSAAELGRLIAGGDSVDNQIARGFSKSYVNMLLAIMDNCIPPVLEAFRNGLSALEAAEYAILGCDKTGHVAQKTKWTEKTTSKVAGGETKVGDTSEVARQRNPGKRASVAALTKALTAALDGAEDDDEYRQGAIFALQFALNRAPNIPGVYEPESDSKTEPESE